MESDLHRRIVVSLAGLILGAHGFSAMALDPGYVDAVEADLAEFTTGQFVAPENSSWVGGAESEANQSMDLAGFSSFIQSKSPGSYIFYKKLPVEYQQQLHKDYLATGDLDRIKDDIFKYTRQVKN